MISASYRNYRSYPNNRDSPSNRQSRYVPRSASSNSNSNLKSSSSSSSDFIYKEANKHQWAKLQSKIRQRLMAEHISYIDDDEEMARRRFPPPPATFLAPPAFLETAADKEDRQRQQKLIDEEARNNTGTCSQRISPRESQRTTNSYRSPSSQISRGLSRI